MTKKKSSKVIKVTMATLATTVAVGGNSIVSLQAINNDNSDTAILDENSVTSPIIISEIVADSHQSDLTTTSGSDAFEYFELYNTSNQSINLDDYQVLYNNGSTISEWDLPANTILPANEALIVWIQNEESKDLDLALFREYYNLSADEGQIVKTENIVSGFSNSGQRELRVTVKNTKQILSSVIYNDEDVKAQTKKGINFIYNSGRIQESTYSYDLDPTPGSLIEQQKLESKYQFVTVSDGIVTINTAQEINAGEALVVKATTNLPGVILKATLKVNDKEYDMTYDNDGNYVYSVPASEISNEELLNITATFNDGINEITSATQTVTVNKGAVEFASPLLISELSPNSANVSGSDAYEYLQIFNVSDQSVAVNNYQLVYVNGDKETLWQLDDDIVLDAKEVLTVWIVNDAVEQAGLTVADFNNNYGTNFVTGDNFTTIHSDGMSNSGTRGFKIITNTNQELTAVNYSASDSNNGKIDTDEAIYYNYTSDSGVPVYDNEVTLGKLNSQQLITGSYITPAIVENPEVEIEADSFVSANANFTVRVENTNLTNMIIDAKLNLYQDENVVASYDLLYTDGILKVDVPAQDLTGYSNLTYDVTITDGLNTVTSAKNTVVIEQPGMIDQSKVAPLVISEIMPDSSNVGGSDGYEFIEIYNNSNLDINLKDYKLYYNYPDQGTDGDVVWYETNEDKIIKSHDTLVFWIKNGANDDLQISDFNNKFNTNLDSDHLISIYNAGMANGSARGLKITSNIKDVLDYVLYNMDGVDDTTADKSIVYQNRYDGSTFTSVIVDNSAEPSPGTVTEKPMYEAVLPETVSLPVYQDQTPAAFNEDNDLTFSLDVKSNDTTIKSVYLYLKDNNSEDYEVYNLLRNSGDNFSKTLPAVDLYNKSSYTYYFVISDGYQQITTPVNTVNNENPVSAGDQINISEGAIINQTEQIIGTGNNLIIDDQDVTNKAVKSINGNARIVFDTTQTDVFFKNAVAIGNDVIGVFNEGTYSDWRTYAYDINASYFDSETKTITIAFHAGNKANALEHNVENNDDFTLKNIRLTLPDGTTLRASQYSAVYGLGAVEHTEDNWKPDSPVEVNDITPEKEISMGDGTSKVEILYATFTLDEQNFNALRYDLDTTKLEDGTHSVTSGSKTVSFVSDNTAPVIETNMVEGQIYHNGTIEGSAQDAICDTSTLIATLDGQGIQLPYDFRSLEMTPGNHQLVLTASDMIGNVTSKVINFVTPEENAAINGEITPVSGTTVNGDPTFKVTVSDSTDDLMQVAFKRGERYLLGDANITLSSGISQISGNNTQDFSGDSGDGFPYQQFDVKVSGNISDEATVKIDWEGKSNNQKTFMYAYNYATNTFDKLDTVMEIDGETMKLTGEVILKDHLFDQTIKIMVQNGEGYTPDQYGEDVTGTMSNPADTPRENYDFTFAIESDTQYYNEDFDGNPVQDVDGNYQYQLDIHNWLIANRERMNIQYLFHDGDIIDDEDQGQEWINADNAYKMLDDANIPYGVLAGNHDVGHLSGDYTSFSKYFGEDRYNQNPWYGESYQDNRGHYDLITVDGIDFIMVYMGWGIGDQEIQWMNDVLARYPERKAILNFHEYLLASGGLGEEPQRIYNEVVAVNPNVCMVLSGHYHNAQTVVSQFDDNHDGVNDRNVYQMLFDYQGLAQGGMGYMRLMHFDNTNGQIIIRTYSPSLDDYNAKDESNIGDVANINGEEEFVINYSDLGITPVQKQIETTNLDVNIYNDDTFGIVNDVRSNQEISYTLENAPHGLFGWYVEISDANGGLTRSNVNYVNIDKHNIKPTIVLPDDEFNKIAVGTDFDPLKDVKAYDSQGNDLTSQIVVLGSVDVDKAGRYELTYQVADSFNNVTIVTRVVEVVENDDDQDINVQPGDDSNPNGTTGTNGTTSASVNTPFTGDLVNSNYLTLAIASLMTFILMIKKYLKDLKNNH